MKKIYKVYNVKNNDNFILQMFMKDFLIICVLMVFLVVGGLSELHLESILGSFLSVILSVILYLSVLLHTMYLVVDILYACMPMLSELHVLKLDNTIVYNNERSKVIRVKRFIFKDSIRIECLKMYEILKEKHIDKLEEYGIENLNVNTITNQNCGVIQYLYDNKKMKRV